MTKPTTPAVAPPTKPPKRRKTTEDSATAAVPVAAASSDDAASAAAIAAGVPPPLAVPAVAIFDVKDVEHDRKPATTEPMEPEALVEREESLVAAPTLKRSAPTPMPLPKKAMVRNRPKVPEPKTISERKILEPLEVQDSCAALLIKL